MIKNMFLFEIKVIEKWRVEMRLNTLARNRGIYTKWCIMLLYKHGAYLKCLKYKQAYELMKIHLLRQKQF